MTKQPTLVTYVEYVCIKSFLTVWPGDRYDMNSEYIKGHKYYFPEDEDPGDEFKMVVDLNDFPVTIQVRI